MTVTTAPATRQKQESQIPLGRFGQAAEVAAVVRFLLSERAAFITQLAHRNVIALYSREQGK